MGKIYIILFLFFSFVSAQDFLKNVKAQNLAIYKIVEPEPEDTFGISNFSKFYYNNSNTPLHPHGKLRAEVRGDNEGFLDGIYVVDLKTGKEIFIDKMSCVPKWSPDGKYLAYLKAKILPEINPKTGRNRLGEDELWISSPLGENKKKLTEGRHCWEFLWSSDSKFIVYEGYKIPKGRTLIASVDIESGKETVIDSGGLYTDIYFSISPDGKMVAYTKPLKEELIHEWVPTHSELFIANIDGSYKKQITNTKEIEGGVKWLSDGRSLIVEQFEPDGNKVKIIKILLKKI